MQLNGAQILIQTLIEQGVTDVFGYPGGQVINIYDALYEYKDKINHVLTAHEQGASHAADGYSRATGKVGVCIATSGPGATNLVTGIATAMLDSIPMVAITGNVPCSLIGKDSFQEIDITGVTLPITKHNFFVSSIADLADTLREAFRIAKSGRPGPVLVDIPKDVQVAKYDYESQPIVEKTPLPKVKESEIDEAAALINEAKKPYIYVGGGAAGLGLGADILAFAEKIGAVIGCSLWDFRRCRRTANASSVCKVCMDIMRRVWRRTRQTLSWRWACVSRTERRATSLNSPRRARLFSLTPTVRKSTKTCA